MNISDLVAALDAAQVSRRLYAVYGRKSVGGAVYAVVDSDDLSDEGGLILSQNRNGEWVVEVRERGTQRMKARFSSEDEACRWMRHNLTPPQQDGTSGFRPL